MKLSAVFVGAWLLAMAATVLGPSIIDTPSAGTAVQRSSSIPSSLYANDQNHLWNRLHRMFYVRADTDGTEHGFDEVDPLLWRETTYLLTEPSRSSATRLLDEFLETGGERLITDPLRRAVFQHDLWAVFDWLAARADHHIDARKVLMARVARVIRRVALSQDQIERLPDNYAAAVRSGAFASRFDPAQPARAFLPPDLTTTDGRWVVISATDPIAGQHADEVSHSSFSVRWHVPGGPAPTLAYLKKLWDHPEPYVVDPHASGDGERRVMVNPALPPIPAETHVALVRRMLLIDQRGMVVPSSLTESVQLRVLQERDQRFFEFKTSRTRLFAGEAGGLQAVQPGDAGFFTFSSHGIDPFEGRADSGLARPGEILQRCRACHDQPGRPRVHSILSLRRVLRPYSALDSRHPRWNRWYTQDAVAAERKSRRSDWGLLQGFWLSNPW
jgi:hypothetical protein